MINLEDANFIVKPLITSSLNHLYVPLYQKD